jgi:hypothetical protein
VDLLWGEFPAGGVRELVDGATHLLVHEFGQLVAKLVFEHVGDPALAGLGIDPDDGLVVAADVGRIHGDVKYVPNRIRFLPIPRLLDGILVRAAEGREHQVTRVGMTRVHLHASRALVHLADPGQVAQIEARVDPVGVQVQGEGDQIEIARTFAIAEQSAFDPVGAGEQGQFRGRHSGTTIVVRMERDQRAVATRQMRAHPLDLVGVDIRGGILDRGGQVEDDFGRRRGLPHVGDGLANLQGETPVPCW